MSEKGPQNITMPEAYSSAFDAAEDAGKSRYESEKEIVSALENIGDSLELLTGMNRTQVGSATKIHEKLNELEGSESIDDEYILSEVDSLLDEKLEGYRSEDTDDFSTWSNYNFGTQMVPKNFSARSNYNFGTQMVPKNFSARSNYNFGTQVQSFDDVNVIEGDISEDILNQESGQYHKFSEPSVYNPQIEANPTINITAGDEGWSFDQAS